MIDKPEYFVSNTKISEGQSTMTYLRPVIYINKYP